MSPPGLPEGSDRRAPHDGPPASDPPTHPLSGTAPGTATPTPADAPTPAGAADADGTAAIADSQGTRRATVRFLLAHPAHVLALGFGSGLSPWAPGTVGTLWAWASYMVLQLWLGPGAIGLLIAAGVLVGWWACTRTAAGLRQADPSSIVWDEIVAFWAVLWLLMPASWLWQLAAFGLFRLFDAAKPGPVGWADRVFHHRRNPWARGFGILWDDLVAAGCTLLVLAVAVALTEGGG
jgi:phosphatidylglycerophosphatase A